MRDPRILDESLLVAWNAAYWMMRSEARRQSLARYPDCNWRAVEADDDWISAVATAQAEACLEAMHPVRLPAPAPRPMEAAFG